jgi:hypothetical protein
LFTYQSKWFAMRDDHIFIMAPPRSGTKMLARSLARFSGTYLITEHTRKALLPEEQNPTPDPEFWQQAFGLSRLPLQEIEFDAKAFAVLNDLWGANAGGRRLLIKNPNNVVRAEQIRQAFPNAQFVWLLRNPWAVIQSMFGGKQAGRKTPMFLGAADILQHTDPFLRAATSWLYAVRVMREVGTTADITTRYEDLVRRPERELDRIADRVGLSSPEGAADIPQWRKEDFRVARYLMRRSPEAARAVEMVAPVAAEFGYPSTPPRRFPGDDRIFGMRYLVTCLQRPTKTPPYGFPRLQTMSAALMKARAKFRG